MFVQRVEQRAVADCRGWRTANDEVKYKVRRSLFLLRTFPAHSHSHISLEHHSLLAVLLLQSMRPPSSFILTTRSSCHCLSALSITSLRASLLVPFRHHATLHVRPAATVQAAASHAIYPFLLLPPRRCPSRSCVSFHPSSQRRVAPTSLDTLRRCCSPSAPLVRH